MTSIRHKMALWMALAVFVVTAVFCGLTYLMVRHMLIVGFERAALEQLRSVANTVKVWTDGDIYVELNPSLMVGFAAYGDRAFVVRDISERALIEESISLQAAKTTMAGLDGATREAPVFGEGRAPNGADAIVVTQIMPAQWGWDLADTDIETAPGVRETQVEITVAIDRTPLDERLRSLGLLTTLIAIASALAAAITALVTVRNVLRPLDHLANRAAEIREPSYDRPFPDDGPTELRPIAERLNDLLARLADASLVERRFTADAAHELRTPIAELRTLTDVALRFPTAPEQMGNVIRSSNELSVRLTSLIDALLGIARKDAIAAALQTAPVNTLDILRRGLAKHAAQAEQRGLRVDLSVPEDHGIMSDETLLQSVFDNLVGNAISHAPSGATVDISYIITEQGFRLTVSNPAPAMEPGDLASVFEPFWRKDGQQSGQDHAGLGLALCRGFADILGLDLSAELRPLGTFLIILTSRMSDK
ncbi:MAG: HAMP domain-containing sensor histidine kinase [Pseudomonadota bacterium]